MLKLDYRAIGTEYHPTTAARSPRMAMWRGERRRSGNGYKYGNAAAISNGSWYGVYLKNQKKEM